MRLGTINRIAMVVVLVTFSLLLFPPFFMPPQDAVIATYPADTWQAQQQKFRAYVQTRPGLRVDTPTENTVILAALGHRGCFRDTRTRVFAIFSCTIDGEIIRHHKPLVWIALAGLAAWAVYWITAFLWNYRCVSQMRATHEPPARWWYWPSRKPHNFMGAVAYWKSLVPADKAVVRTQVLMLVLTVLVAIA